MAPPNGTARSRKTGSGAPARQAPRNVKPAIPLPHVKRQAAAAAAAAAEAGKRAASPLSEHKGGAAASPGQPEESLANGASDDRQLEKTTTYQEGSSDSPALSAVNGHVESDVKKATSERPGHSNMVPTPRARAADGVAGDSRRDGSRHELSNGTGAVDGTEPSSAPSAAQEPSSSVTVAPVANPTEPHPRQLVPPPFQPVPRPPVVDGPSHAQQSRPSNAGVHFGAFASSANSSPAPPLSGGIAPPPGMPLPDGRQPFIGPAGNGFHPPVPPGPDMMAANSLDAYGRPGMPYPLMDPYQHHGNSFPPSTPQSFHDSQSSGHPDESGPYHTFAPPASRSGAPGFVDDAGLPNAPARMRSGMGYPGMGMQQAPPPSMMQHDESAGLLGHVQQQFGSTDFADCFLELRHRDSRVAPLRVPGHRVILSRSPLLGDLLRERAQKPTPQTLAVEARDELVRAESFYIACQNLYGLPLLAVPPPPQHGVENDGVTAAGSSAERFGFALSYAASGHLLGWGPIVRRGCEIAAQLLGPETAEMAMQFALDGYRDNGAFEKFKYGDGSRVLLDAVLGLAANKLQPAFRLDTGVTGAPGYARLPYDAPAPPESAPNEESDSPVTVRGKHRRHLSRGSRSQNAPHIQFGDLSLANGRGGDPSDHAGVSHQTLAALNAALSRILINMPFGLLKMLLETSGTFPGWASPETRLWVVQEVVREREARRHRALDAISRGQVPESGAVLESLRRSEPPQSNPWAILGWQEEVIPPSNANGPQLGRRWTPLKEDRQDAIPAYP